MLDTTTVENTSVADNNRSLDKYARFAVPASGKTDYLSGSYFRLGTYKTTPSEDSSLYPLPYLDLSDDSKPVPDGLFLKTDGVLFLTVQEGAYMEFDDVLSVYIAKDATTRSDETMTFVGPEVIFEADASLNDDSDVANPGKLTITGSDAVEFDANGSNIVITAGGSLKKRIGGDHHVDSEGDWSAYGRGSHYTYFGGFSLGVFVGGATTITAGVILTVVNLFMRVTLGYEFVVYGLGRLTIGLMDLTRISTGILGVNVEIKNRQMKIHDYTVTMSEKNLNANTDELRAYLRSQTIKKSQITVSNYNILHFLM